MPKAVWTLALPILLAGLTKPISFAQAQSVRWQARYTQIYSDDIETMGPSLHREFALGAAGALIAAPSEVLSGKMSIKGANSGNVAFLTTNSSVLPLLP